MTSESEDDIDEWAVEEWTRETTPFERVHAIVRRTDEPQSAGRIAERARVAEPTARKHLRTLVDAGAVTTESEGKTTLYRRSRTAVVTERAEQLLTEHSPGALAERVGELKTQLRDWRVEYGVESPEALARELSVADADTEIGSVVTEWQTTRRNLALAEAALAIAETTRWRDAPIEDDDAASA
jgi:DNA-binding transcriptional ArsR family regulator